MSTLYSVTLTPNIFQTKIISTDSLISTIKFSCAYPSHNTPRHMVSLVAYYKKQKLIL